MTTVFWKNSKNYKNRADPFIKNTVVSCIFDIRLNDGFVANGKSTDYETDPW